MLDWDDLRVFLAITRHRTLSGAARQLHVTQSTVGRRLAAMQATLGVRLLQRTADGFQLTLAGEAILPNAKRVEAAALEVEQAVAGQDVRLEGTVRVATTQLVGSHLLAAGFAALHARNTAIVVEVMAHAPIDPLSRNEADISVQMVRFEHHDVVMRSLGVMQFGLYGSLGYFDRCGEPDLESGAAGHRLIGLVESIDLPPLAGWTTEFLGRAQFVMKSDSYELQHGAAMSGSGLAVLPRFRADCEPELRRVAVPLPPPAAEIWLGVHRDNRKNPRVRVVLDTIAAAVRSRAFDLDPAAVRSVPTNAAD